MTTNKYMSNAGNFDCHADTAVRCGAHCLVEHIPGFTQGSHWMPPLDECLHCIAAAATMVDDFSRKHKTLTKTIFS
jgi:hypothetical protein